MAELDRMVFCEAKAAAYLTERNTLKADEMTVRILQFITDDAKCGREDTVPYALLACRREPPYQYKTLREDPEAVLFPPVSHFSDQIRASGAGADDRDLWAMYQTWVSPLPTLHRRILYAWAEGMTVREIGRAAGVPAAEVSRILRNSIRVLRKQAGHVVPALFRRHNVLESYSDLRILVSGHRITRDMVKHHPDQIASIFLQDLAVDHIKQNRKNAEGSLSGTAVGAYVCLIRKIKDLTVRTEDPFLKTAAASLEEGAVFYLVRHFSEPPYPGVPVSGFIDGVRGPYCRPERIRRVILPDDAKWAGWAAHRIGQTEGLTTASSVIWTGGRPKRPPDNVKPWDRAILFGARCRGMRPEEFDTDKLDAEDGMVNQFVTRKGNVSIWRNPPDPADSSWEWDHGMDGYSGKPAPAEKKRKDTDVSTVSALDFDKLETDAKSTAAPAAPEAYHPQPDGTGAPARPVPNIAVREISVAELIARCMAILFLIGVLCVGAAAVANRIWKTKSGDKTESAESVSDGFDSIPTDAIGSTPFVPTVTNLAGLLNKDTEDVAYTASLGAASNTLFDWTCQAYGRDGVLQIKEDARIHTVTEVRWWTSIADDPQPLLDGIAGETGKPYLETDEYGKRTWDFTTEDYTCLLIQGSDGTSYCLDVKRK